MGYELFGNNTNTNYYLEIIIGNNTTVLGNMYFYVGTIYFWEYFQGLPLFGNTSRDYHYLGILPWTTTIWEYFQGLPLFGNTNKKYFYLGILQKQLLFDNY